MTVPKSISDDGLLSTSEVATKLGVHRSTVWLYISRGALESEKHGAFHGVRPSALVKFQDFYNLEDREHPARRGKKKKLTGNKKKSKKKSKSKKRGGKRG